MKTLRIGAQAVVAGQGIVAPFGGFVADYILEKLCIFATQFGFSFASAKRFGAGDGPLGAGCRRNHNMAHAFNQQGWKRSHSSIFAVGMLEDGGDGVAALDRCLRRSRRRSRCRSWLPRNHADAAFVFHAELEDFEDLGPRLTMSPTSQRGVCTVVEVDFVEQKGEFVEAAFDCRRLL